MWIGTFEPEHRQYGCLKLRMHFYGLFLRSCSTYLLKSWLSTINNSFVGNFACPAIDIVFKYLCFHEQSYEMVEIRGKCAERFSELLACSIWLN